MKSKTLIFSGSLLFVLAIFAAVMFNSCSKNSTVQSERPLANTLAAENDPKNEQTKCNCPQQSTCSSDCQFGNCCICWSSGTHEGACGCLLGFPSCKSAKKDGGWWRLDDPEVSHEVTVKPSAIAAYFAWLETNSIDADAVESSYQNIVNAYEIEPTDISVLISIEDYVPLITAYENFMSELTPTELASIEAYINN